MRKLFKSQAALPVVPGAVPCAVFCVLCCAFVSAGCEIGAKPKVALPAPPPPAAPPPQAAIVENQTVAQLPASQPVPPESIPPRPPVEYHPQEAEAEPAPRTAAIPAQVRPRVKKTAATETSPVPETAETVPPPATPALTTPPVEEHPAIPPTLRSAEETSLTKAQVSGLLDEVRKLLEGIAVQPASATTKQAINRINSFVRLSEQSAAHDDLRQADTLARRALAVARDLSHAK